VGLFRQIFKPLFMYYRNPEYREYLRVQDACRNKDNQHVIVELNGFTIECNDGPSLLHQYEEIVRRKSFDFTPKNDSPVIFCCGANIGLEVLRLGNQYPKARIKAYEADPQIFSLLQRNITGNKISAEAYNAAVHTENGTVKFQSDGKLGGKTGTGSMEIKSIRFSEVLGKEDRVDLLIMDIEGAENEVLQDCADQLHKVENLFVEWHGSQQSPQQLSEFLNLLKQSGFRYRLNNNIGISPFVNPVSENGFDAMVEIYATQARR